MNDEAKFKLQYAGSCEIEFDVDYLDIDIKTPNWKPSKWTDITLIWSMPEAFRLNLKDLSEISDEEKKILGVPIDAKTDEKGWARYLTAKKLLSMDEWSLWQYDYLRSRAYLLPFTVAVEKPTVRDFEHASIVKRWGVDCDVTAYDREAHQKALSEWKPSKTYSIEEIKELGWVK